MIKLKILCPPDVEGSWWAGPKENVMMKQHKHKDHETVTGEILTDQCRKIFPSIILRILVPELSMLYSDQ